MSDKAVESAVGPKSQLKRFGKPIIALPFKKRLTMALLSVREEAEESSQPGGSAVSLEVDDPKVTAMSVVEDVPHQLPIPVKINMEIKEKLKKEIRHLGGKYEKVFKLLQGVQGTPELRRSFFLYAMKESRRFKRQDLINNLEKTLKEMESDQVPKKDNDAQNL